MKYSTSVNILFTTAYAYLCMHIYFLNINIHYALCVIEPGVMC